MSSIESSLSENGLRSPNISSRPKVSVIVPAYNAESTIGIAIHSALRQTMADLEVVVCDDASTDRTLQLLQSIDDSRLVILQNTNNQGEGITRDRALSAARGEWVAVLDADDVWDEHRLERMLRASENDPHVMVFDDLLICHHTPEGLAPWRSMRGPKAFGGDGKTSIDVRPEWWADSHQFLIKPLIHTGTLRESGVKHTTLTFGADTEFFLKLVAYGFRLRYLPEALYHYRIMPNSASANSRRMELMNTMLASMLPMFDGQPEVQTAIRRRIQYRRLLQHIKNREFRKAARLVTDNPGALAEFTHRAARQALYLGHRRLKSGASR